MNKSNTGLIYGLIAGLGVIIYTLVLYLTGVEAFTGKWGYFVYLIIIVLAIVAAWKLRNEQGYLEFPLALKTTFSVFAISILLQIIFNYILLNYIDTGFREAVTQIAVDKTESMLKDFGTPQSKIDEVTDAILKEDPTSLKNLIISYGMWCIIAFLVSLIISAVMKKNKPVFENDFNQS